MQLLNAPIRAYFGYREERIVSLYEHALETQEKWFTYLIRNGLKTKFGHDFGFTPNMSYEAFRRNVPIQNYNALYPYIERIIKGEEDVLWNAKVEWMAKSSGTTQAKSKFIPITNDSLKLNNYLSAKDSLTFYIELFPETEMFAGKGITLGGSIQKMEMETKVKCGDISAVLMENMPAIGEYLKAPHKDVLLNDDWNTKLHLIAEHTVNENITSISGVPSWMLLVLKEVLKISGKQSMSEAWPNLEVFFHGGVAFHPYREEYTKMLSHSVFFMNMYNASEGFFGLQDQRFCDDLLLLTDNGVFYEFLEIDEMGVTKEQAIPLQEVKLHQQYALVMTTPAGLWRYEIGDTIIFTSLRPYRFQITGRTTHYINAFGEELIMDNANKAIAEACRKTGAILTEFTAAPTFVKTNQSEGRHQWLIEFSKQPDDIEKFRTVLDQTLKSLNSDYEAKRTGNLLLDEPEIIIAAEGTFMKWLTKKNKLGGQYKVPRLQNDRGVMGEMRRHEI
ncbi:MAG: GH3 auxin-responsive promoter family protein [Lentimicrobiaceae bacterium]|nr:GH3 auxin-responsive promoter family protein [Lentimicrobiaceae bacterium]